MNKFGKDLPVLVTQITNNGPIEVVRGKIISIPTENYDYYTILIDNPYDVLHPFFVAREEEITELKND